METFSLTFAPIRVTDIARRWLILRHAAKAAQGFGPGFSDRAGQIARKVGSPLRLAGGTDDGQASAELATMSAERSAAIRLIPPDRPTSWGGNTMERREFLGSTLATTALWDDGASKANSPKPVGAIDAIVSGTEVFVERSATDKPHAGKVLASIAPHSDDHSILAGGTIAKLIDEGYTGYLIRTSNDERDSYDLTLGQTIAANEKDNEAMAKALGFKQVFNLDYRNHDIDDVSRVEMRARLIFLFRLLKVDTIFSYDPWGHYEENPDHYVTAQCVEAACWMAGGHLDFPEHFAAGLKPHVVREKYYYARGPQAVNRVVDISTTIDKKMTAIRANKTMLGNMVREARDQLAARNLKLPELDGDLDGAIRAYADLRFREGSARRGQDHGLKFAERFHYIGPDTSLDEYIARHAVPLR
jgi:LmbE family N-acetylglucosaminyl deacetylase